MDEINWTMPVSALLTGGLFGYVLQRGGFCLTRALSNAVLIGDTTILRAYVLALLVATIGVQVLAGVGLVDIPVRSFRWLANLTGGLAFGVGMILAGGCAGSTWYRVGEGAVGAWVVLLGFAMGATAAAVGVLGPLRAWLQAPVVTVDASAPTLASLVGLPAWLVVAVLAAAAAVWLVRARGEPEHGKWPWPVAGAAVGLLIAAGWWASATAGRPVGITFAANTGHLLSYPLVGYPRQVSWSMLMALAVPVGAFLGAWPTGEFRWKLPPGWSLVKIFAGGLLMGASALVAEGCNITQALSNAATLAVGSLVTALAMGAGGWLALWALYLRRG
jgi:hypothetical protein